MSDEDEQKYANLQPHLAKVTLAKAALAGVTYRAFKSRWPHASPVTRYYAVLPDGTGSQQPFNDELEAAIWALTVLDPQTPARPIEGFMLKPENEQ
jgi:hypothetical protein